MVKLCKKSLGLAAFTAILSIQDKFVLGLLLFFFFFFF